jgi:hypothetical protein
VSLTPTPACNADATAPEGTVSERYFLTYRGISLPLQLTEELARDALRNRNTYYRAYYGANGLMLRCEQRVYGEVELQHDYRYNSSGQLVEATITQSDEEPRVLTLAP